MCDIAAANLRLEFASLPRLEVTGVFVDVDSGAQARYVQFGMELGGVNMRADLERLHRALRGTGEQDGVPWQPADRLFVTHERIEGGRQPAQQRVLPALLGERDGNGTDRL